MAKTMGMASTHFADASGFSSQTVSSASDLALLGLAALQQPTLMEIAGQSQAAIPVAGVIHNVNMLIGQNEIIGIKTGNTDEAGGVYLAAANHSFDASHTFSLVAVVMGAPTLSTAMNSAVTLLNSAYKSFALTTVVHSGEVVATYTFPWSKAANITASKDLSVFTWSGKALQPKLSLNPISTTLAKGSPAGTISADSATEAANVQAVLQNGPSQPPIWWRLTHF
jgi:D-alanyl-D-alanine carboxypeptidase (penicillin-binding protein 5/6)